MGGADKPSGTTTTTSTTTDFYAWTNIAGYTDSIASSGSAFNKCSKSSTWYGEAACGSHGFVTNVYSSENLNGAIPTYAIPNSFHIACIPGSYTTSGNCQIGTIFHEEYRDGVKWDCRRRNEITLKESTTAPTYTSTLNNYVWSSTAKDIDFRRV